MNIPLRTLILPSLACTAIALTAGNPEILIVTPDALLYEAEALAQLHRDRLGSEVMVTPESAIGTGVSIDDVKAHVRSVYSLGALRYLIVMGDSWADTRSDTWLGCLSDDSDGLPEHFSIPDIAVGRIPAPAPEYAAGYVDKVARYLDWATARHSSTMIIACDDGDNHEHLNNSERIASIFPDATIHKIYLDTDRQTGGDAVISRERLLQALSQGAGTMFYTGHGNSTAITGEGLWDAAMAHSHTYTSPPWAFFSSCEVNAYGNVELTLSERMLYNPQGGAMGVIAAREPVFSSYNQRLAVSFAGHLAASAPGATVGDLWLAAQQEGMESARRTMNTAFGKNIMAYTFAGDPALPLFLPDYGIVLSSSGDAVIHGTVTDIAGQRVEQFDGMAEVTVFARPVEHVTLGQRGDAAGIPVSFDDTPLWRGSTAVAGGLFELPVTLPDATASGSYRVAVYAADDSGTEAMSTTRLYLPASATDDTEPPAVAISTSDGSRIVETPFSLLAEASDSGSGINLSGASLNSGICLTVDGKRIRGIATLCNPGGSVSLSAEITRLDPGNHNAFLSVTDNAGNRAETTFAFSVVNTGRNISLTTDATNIHDEVTFFWSHDFAGTPELTLTGNSLYGDGHIYLHPADTGELTIDASTLPTGIYRCTMLATDGRHRTSSQPIIIRILH